MNSTLKTVLKWVVIIAVPCGLIALLVYKFIPSIWNKIKRTFAFGSDEIAQQQAAANFQWAKTEVNKAIDIPQNWQPLSTANKLEAAMKGWGTDETAIFAALAGLNRSQILAVYIAFGTRDGQDLGAWFRGDLSGEILTRALNIFSEAGIPI